MRAKRAHPFPKPESRSVSALADEPLHRHRQSPRLRTNPTHRGNATRCERSFPAPADEPQMLGVVLTHVAVIPRGRTSWENAHPRRLCGQSPRTNQSQPAAVAKRRRSFPAAPHHFRSFSALEPPSNSIACNGFPQIDSPTNAKWRFFPSSCRQIVDRKHSVPPPPVTPVPMLRCRLTPDPETWLTRARARLTGQPHLRRT